jgi:eukaryotic-like serine/threonine-protein kinase
VESAGQVGAKSVPVVQTRFGEAQGRLSPDGRWLAYSSNDSGRYEVYVQPFGAGATAPATAAAGKWQISGGGGVQPVWNNDGKELFYVTPDRKLMAVQLAANRSMFSRGTSRELFSVRFNPQATGNPNYAVSPDGKRFLIANELAEADQPPLTVVVNWPKTGKK